MIWFIKDDGNIFINTMRKSKQTKEQLLENLLTTVIAMLTVINEKQNIKTEYGTLIFMPKNND